MADEGPDDVDLIKTTRIVCQHGAVNEVTVRTEQVGHDCKVTVTQRICEKCLEEMEGARGVRQVHPEGQDAGQS